MTEQKTKIDNPLDAAIYGKISKFAIDQLDKMLKDTFSTDDYKAKLEDTTIDIRNLFMRLRKANMI